MARYKSRNLQDIIDIAIQNFGDIESGLFDFLTTNGLNLNSKITGGTVFTLNNENKGVVRVQKFFKTHRFIVSNADQNQINTTIGEYNNDFNNDFNNITL
jgi:hypothetical protein